MRRVNWVRLRQRGFTLLKIGVFTLFCWWLIVFGFNQDSSSEFGENLERNQIEKSLKLSDTHFTEKSDFSFVKSEKVLPVDDAEPSKNLKNSPDKINPRIWNQKNVTLFNNPQIETNSSTRQYSKVSWQFSKPPNIFDDENVGELGVAVKMPENLTSQIQKLYDDGWATHQFNQYLSDLISVHRKLPDYRSDYCKNMEPNYRKNLPATSVIFIFHNEAWSTLLRSVHSVLDRSPEHLITEIILVDDFSDLGS